MLKKRVLTSVIGIPILVAVLWFDSFLPLFTILAVTLGILSNLECARLISLSKTKIFVVYSIILTIGVIALRDSTVLSFIGASPDALWIPGVLIAGTALPLLVTPFFLKRQTPGTYNRLSGLWTTVAILYNGWLISNLIGLRGLEDGRNWVFLSLFVTFAYDTSAFFTGRSLGRHKMAPRISPGKTWEGAAGGVVGAVLVSLFFTLPTPLGLPLPWYHAVILGLLVSLFGQSGDLLESAFKRYTGVKDSGNALPGHGGWLDRLDSIVFAGLVVYYYAVWVLQ
jgi:phosphatidate cytidylyltransferase